MLFETFSDVRARLKLKFLSMTTTSTELKSISLIPDKRLINTN